MASFKDNQVIIPATCDFVTSHGKQDLTVKALEMEGPNCLNGSIVIAHILMRARLEGQRRKGWCEDGNKGCGDASDGWGMSQGM